MDQQGMVTNTVEIIDLINPKFKHKLNDERAARVAPFGGILQNQPLLFAGMGSCDLNHKALKDGIALGSNEKIYKYETEGRRCASSIILNQTRLWVTGGQDEKGNDKKSSQFISLDQPPEKGPKLPFTVSNHCMAQVDSKTIYLIGGYQNGDESNQTWIIDPTKNFEIREGISMNHSRASNSCATMRLKNKVFIVVVGSNDSVEILDTSLTANNWKFGR